jgi:hypothetical protein
VELVKYWFIRVGFKWLRFAAIACVLTTTRAAEEMPELDFLEYLGIWQENDEEWLAVSEWEGDEGENSQAPQEERKDDDKEN